jgi:hypothetical protein
MATLLQGALASLLGQEAIIPWFRLLDGGRNVITTTLVLLAWAGQLT